MELIPTRYGGFKIIYEGYAYIKQKNLADGVESYECVKRRQKKVKPSECKAKIKVKNRQVVGKLNEHTHAPEPGHSKVKITKQNVKYDLSEPEDSHKMASQEIAGSSRDGTNSSNYKECLRQPTYMEPAAFGLHPGLQSSCSMMSNKGQTTSTKSSFQQQNDRSLSCFCKVWDLSPLPDGSHFVLFDSGTSDNDRIIVFGTPKGLRLLGTSPHWFADELFLPIPKQFMQIYTIHACAGKHMFPCVYALLSNKTKDTYTRLFQELISLNAQLRPATVTMNFELNAMNAVMDTFRDAQIQGSFYHLWQKILLMLREHKQEEKYCSNADFNSKVRKIAALAFVPAKDVVMAFHTMKKELPPDLVQILTKFIDDYIGHLGSKSSQKPVFGPKLWSVYDHSQEELELMSNIDDWHKALQTEFTSGTLNVWKFLDVHEWKETLLDAEGDTRNNDEDEPPKKRLKYSHAKDLILATTQKYASLPIMQYVHCIANDLTVCI